MHRTLTWAALGVGGLLAVRALTKKPYSFQGKTVLLTGGSRGLGLVLARQLLDAGARVSICARDPDELDRAYEELAARGGHVLAVPCDVTDPASVHDWVAVTRQRLGPTDVLINNAGLIGVGPIEEMRLEDFELAMRTHFWANLYTCLEVIPEMRRRGGGRIVNVSSIGGKIAVPHLLPYSASKFALVGLSEGLRAELAEDNIVVTTICPGLMRTGSPLNAEFKGQHRKEYAWFTLGDSLPGLSVSAEYAARQILAACARGDAELILSLPAKAAALFHDLFPNLSADLFALVHRWILPAPGGVGPERIKGRDSQGLLPSAVTVLTDRAAERNNENAPTLPVPGAAG